MEVDATNLLFRNCLDLFYGQSVSSLGLLCAGIFPFFKGEGGKFTSPSPSLKKEGIRSIKNHPRVWLLLFFMVFIKLKQLLNLLKLMKSFHSKY